MKKVVIIGSGFAGLSAASFMAQAGWDVTVLEKNETVGGRARQLKAGGFTFDMGPSWYWMPDVFEHFFGCFGKKTGDFYNLKRLDPSYRIYWNEGSTDIPANYEELRKVFESLEPGSAVKLDSFLKEAEYKYKTGIKKLVFKPGQSFSEFLDWDLIKGLFKLDVFTSVRKHVYKFFRHVKLRQLMEFPVLFLGALPQKTPALYSLMNYADIHLGTWYPEGGMYSIASAMQTLAEDLGVRFMFGENVKKINFEGAMAVSVSAERQNGSGSITNYSCDVVIGAADYHFIETSLLPGTLQSYSDNYWNSREMAPGCLLFYIGLNKKLKGIVHHSLFFDVSFEEHGKDIYMKPSWPADPLFYVCTASVTDHQVAPEGGENLFFLIPVAAGLKGDSMELREAYFEKIVIRFERLTGENIRDSIVYKHTFGPDDFVHDYNAFKGNAYGLANTLLQTATLKPSCRSKKVGNLFYTGQLTVPGPGVPPALISGEVVAKQVIKLFV